MRKPLNPKKYKDQTAIVRSWAEIEQHYINLTKNGWDLKPMIELVQHIIKTKISERLFAYTSMDKLVVGIYNPLEWNREVLHIEFDVHSQKWYFMYYPKPNEPIEFERQYDPGAGLDKFDKFIKLKKW